MSQKKRDGGGKPYYSLDEWCKEHYGHKLYKVALDIGCGCPNRDGTIGFGGCHFCSVGGSGDFAHRPESAQNIPVTIRRAAETLSTKWSDITRMDDRGRIIAYFQSYTNTYGNPLRLRSYFEEALRTDGVAGISIGTRPDCLGEEICQLLLELKQRYHDKFIWIELGLQTIHDDVAEGFNRGYSYEIFLRAVQKLREMEIPFVIHLILGLPGEEKYDIMETIDQMNQIRPFGVKIQLLHILEDTIYADLYRRGEITVMSMDEYVGCAVQVLSNLHEDIVIHRITGDGDKEKLLAPEWSKNKRAVLNQIHKKMAEKRREKR